MRTMGKTLGALAVVVLLGTSSTALAVDIGGLDVPVGPTFKVGQIYENIPTAVGDTLAGYGKIDSINSVSIGTLCSGCELTYQFGGYTVTSVSVSEIRYTGGFVKFYLGFGADSVVIKND